MKEVRKQYRVSFMGIGTVGFVPERLIEARQARRINSKLELARRLGVNDSSVSRWENGASSPDFEWLQKLSILLDVRKEHFLRPTSNLKNRLFYRSLASTAKRDKLFQRTYVKWLHDISSIIEHYVEFPKLDIPDVLNGVSYKQLRNENIEQIADDLRKHWGLNNYPCLDVPVHLESIGCIVANLEVGTSKLDGVCSWNDSGRPHILLSKDKMNFPRRQMDAAHELGHAVLHRNVDAAELQKNHKFIEKQAFRFASAFLMPAQSYLNDLSVYSLAAMLNTKSKWRVSVAAQIRRLRDLDVISDEKYTYLNKLYSMKKWRRGEPLDNEWELSKPQTLAQSLELIVESGTRTKDELLSVEFTIPAGDLETLCELPSGWFSNGKIHSLDLNLKKNSKSLFEHDPKVIRFPSDRSD